MSNVIKHSGANEVLMTMNYAASSVNYILKDNGRWKVIDTSVAHYGLENMERRSKRSGFGFDLSHAATGTTITVSLPLTTYQIKSHSV